MKRIADADKLRMVNLDQKNVYLIRRPYFRYDLPHLAGTELRHIGLQFHVVEEGRGYLSYGRATLMDRG